MHSIKRITLIVALLACASSSDARPIGYGHSSSNGSSNPPISSQVVSSPVTTITFSGLHGDTDEVYSLLIESISGAVGNVSLQFNGSSSNLRSGGTGNDSTGTATTPYGEASSTIALLGYLPTVGYRSVVEATIAAKTGAVRMYTANAMAFYSNNTVRRTAVGGVWTDTGTEVTSIVLVSSVSSGFGAGTKATLWKIPR